MRTQNNKTTIMHRLMSEFLLDINPEIHQTCKEMVNSLLEDVRLIPKVFNYIYQNQNSVFNTENAHFYLAVIYRIYSPLHLHSTTLLKLPAGVRDILSNCFGYVHGEMINYFAITMLPHYKNPRWAAQVNKLAFEIVENIKSESGYISQPDFNTRGKKRRFKRLSNYKGQTTSLIG